jgi:hypothetical protein
MDRDSRQRRTSWEEPLGGEYSGLSCATPRRVPVCASSNEGHLLVPVLWKQRGGHACSRYLADEDQLSEVLLHALSTMAKMLEQCGRIIENVDCATKVAV